MSDSAIPPVSSALSALGVDHQIFRHAGPVNSLEQAAAERDQQPEQVVRSLLFRLGAGEYLMVLIAGPEQVAWPALRQYIGRTRITMATQEEVLAVTGYPLGAVAPFGLPAPLPVVVDDSVTAQTEISLGSGVRGTAIILRVADLLQALHNPPVMHLR
jgi:Cys-tRNA(Pro)/Cys-tRNA(Cys) deacylase